MKTLIVLNSDGFDKLLKSGEASDFCEELAYGAKTALQKSYGYRDDEISVTARTGRNRAVIRISTASWRTYYGQKKDNRLLKAVLRQKSKGK